MSIEILKNKAAYMEKYNDLIPTELKRMSFYMESSGEMYVRSYLVKNGMFALITTDFADALAKYLNGKKVLEVMSGAGYLAKALYDRGIDIIATDNNSWNLQQFSDFKIENLDAKQAIKKYNNVDYILVSWIPMGDAGTELIDTIKKYCPNTLILCIGESDDGCTANDYFFEHTECINDSRLHDSQVVFESFDGIYDCLELIKVI